MNWKKWEQRTSRVTVGLADNGTRSKRTRSDDVYETHAGRSVETWKKQRVYMANWDESIVSEKPIHLASQTMGANALEMTQDGFPGETRVLATEIRPVIYPIKRGE